MGSQNCVPLKGSWEVLSPGLPGADPAACPTLCPWFPSGCHSVSAHSGKLRASPHMPLSCCTPPPRSSHERDGPRLTLALPRPKSPGGMQGRFTGPAAQKGSHGCCSPLALMKHPSCYTQGETEAQGPRAAHPRPHTSGGSELGGVPGPWPPGPGSVPLEVLVSFSPLTVPSHPLLCPMEARPQ